MTTALADGTYNVQATAKDNAGNSGSDATTNELMVDTAGAAVTVNPLVTNNDQPTLSGTLNGTFAAGGISSVTVVVGAQTLSATVNGTTWSAAVPTALAVGTYDVQATATDNAGFSASDTATGAVDDSRRSCTTRARLACTARPLPLST